jgi:phosphoribosylpyrophosphate synthetase
MSSDTSMMVFSGNANKELSKEIARRLSMRLGMATVGRFSDGEVTVKPRALPLGDSPILEIKEFTHLLMQW